MVDRLLRKLPYAETATGKPPPGAARRPSGTVPRSSRQVLAGPVSPGLGPWARVGLGMLLAVAVPLWPYGHGCGFGLFAYLVGIITLVVAGVWAGIASWQRQVVVAHVISLALTAWGLGLGAGELLPRVGYAKTQAYWRCSSAARAAAAGPTADASLSRPCEVRASQPLEADFLVEAFDCEGNGTLRLQQRTGLNADGSPVLELRNVIMVPPLARTERFVTAFCRLDGVMDSAIVAVARQGDARMLTDIRVAFRVNVARARFEPVPVDRVTCDNRAYGA